MVLREPVGGRDVWSVSCQALITICISKPLGTDQIASLFVSVETFSKDIY